MAGFGWRLCSRLGALLLLLFFLFLISLPNLIDLDNFRPQLLALLRFRLAGEVQIGRISLTFRRGPGIKIDNVLLNDRSGRQRLAAEQLIVNLELASLFRRRIRLAGLTLVEPRIELRIEPARTPLQGFIKPSPPSAVLKSAAAAGKPLPAAFSKEVSLPLGRGWSVSGQVRDACLEIIDGEVIFSDAEFASPPVKTHLKHLNLELKWHNSVVPAQFMLSTRVLDPTGDGELRIEGILSNLKLPFAPERMFLDCRVLAENLNGGAFFPYYRKHVPLSFIGARVDIDTTYQGSLMGLFHARGRVTLRDLVVDCPAVFGRRLTAGQLQVDCDLRLADSYNTISVRDCRVALDGFQLQGSCEMTRVWSGGEGRIDLDCHSSEFDPSTLIALLPSALLPAAFNRGAAGLLPGGVGRFTTIRLKGSYHQLAALCRPGAAADAAGGLIRLALTGHGLAFSLPGLSSFPIKCDGRLVYLGRRCDFSGINFTWGRGLNGNGIAGSIDDPFGKARLQASGRFGLRLAEFQRQLGKRQPALRRVGQKGKKDKSGFSFRQGALRGELTLKGPLKEPAKLQLSGLLVADRVAFSLPGLALPVEELCGDLHLLRKRIELCQGRGRIGKLQLAGNAALELPTSWMPLPGSSLQLPFSCRITANGVSPEKVAPLLPTASGLAFRGRTGGASRVELEWRGDLARPMVSLVAGRLQLDWRDFSPGRGWPRFDSCRCQATIASQRIDCRQLFVKQGASDLAFSGQLARCADGSTIRGEIVSRHLAPGAFIVCRPEAGKWRWPSGLKLELRGRIDELLLDFGAGAAGTRCLAGQPSPWRRLRRCRFHLSAGQDGRLYVGECSWLWGGQQARFGLSGDLQLAGLPAILNGRLDLKVQDLDLDTLLHNSAVTMTTAEEDAARGAGIPGERPSRRVRVFENLSDVVENDQVRELMDWKRRLAAQNLELAFEAKHLVWHKMVLDHLAGRFRCRRQGMVIDKLTAQAFDGKFYLNGAWNFADDHFCFDLDCNGVNFEKFNDYLKNPARGLPMQGGHGSLSLALDWQGGNLQAWRKHLDGLLDFRFYDGRMKRFTLISNICSLLNVSQLASLRLPRFSQGVPYRTLTGQITVVNGIAEIDDFALKGPGLNLLASGRVDLVNDFIDLKVGVQPLQTVDKMLASIPIVGYIMTGKKKTFIVVPVTARGPFNDVKISTAAVKGLGRKSLDVLRRFFHTPLRWFGPEGSGKR